MKRRPLLLGVAAGIAAAAAFSLFRTTTGPDVGRAVPGPPRQIAEPTVREERQPVGTRRAGDGPPYSAEPPGSLQDTEVDGELVVGADGQFVATREALRLFDYFLSAGGEEPDEVILARIDAAIDERLSPPADAQARQLLARYLDFRHRAQALFAGEGDDADLADRLAKVRALRRQAFGEAEAAALFADEEAAETFAVEARRRLADPNLTEDQKRAALADLEAQMPASVRADRDAALGPQRLAEDEASLRAAGGSPEEVRALREQRYGKEAADRLEELDRQRAEWARRYDSYRAEHDALAADASLSADQRQARIDALRRQRFSEDEQARVAAADELEAE